MRLKDLKPGDKVIVIYGFGESRERKYVQHVTKVGRKWLHAGNWGPFDIESGFSEYDYSAFTEETLAEARSRRTAEVRIRRTHWPLVSSKTLVEIAKLLDTAEPKSLLK